ncbi:MAG: SPOR domain-containing protein [Bacteroidales bacterium]|nr:SPOR domain-containing protein [Bacteroidales bacterium]
MRSVFIFMAGIFISHFLSAGSLAYNPYKSFTNDSVSIGTDIMDIISLLDIRQDIRLEKMLKWHIENSIKLDGMDGYRVEIFFSSAMNARELALNKKKEFLSKYPAYKVHILFSAPNFKVRIGDFRTKNEALKLYKMIQTDYPGAFIVPDIIDFPVLKSNSYE